MLTSRPQRTDEKRCYLLQHAFPDVARLPEHPLGQLLGFAHGERSAFEDGLREGVPGVVEHRLGEHLGGSPRILVAALGER
jgi:hypothetical protein